MNFKSWIDQTDASILNLNHDSTLTCSHEIPDSSSQNLVVIEDKDVSEKVFDIAENVFQKLAKLQDNYKSINSMKFTQVKNILESLDRILN